ncbi:hypothetical protein [Actinoplanes auranticolor]|uniref:Uncharacterized protein n=1 Tax=Actinoplanes auranticolor TaxID=47988 RepID=A0A919T0N9_9ACTN|nr:hypothetical protein [Actinoplanes auranticolor]GIM80826.1 hypothetical protein Aau02nite_92230 [Actinoplanes auranticolor]
MVALPPPAFEARYRTYAFPTGVINGGGKLSFNTDDLAHALVATGRAPGDRSRYGAASAYEWLHRVSLIPAYIRRNYHGRLTRSRLALELDRSELVGVSYALGQAMTAVFCRMELAVSHLLHVDRYFQQYGVQFNGRKRADLFGLSPNGWVVAEAKGRSRTMESELRGKLELQKRSVLTVCGAVPWLALGCVASFPIRDGGMELDAFDPEKAEPDALVIPGGADDAMLAYYLPFVTIIDLGASATDVGQQQLVVGDFGPLGVRVGLLRSIYQRVQRGAQERDMAGFSEDIQVVLREAPLAELGLFPDGTRVDTNWPDAVSVQDWSEDF